MFDVALNIPFTPYMEVGMLFRIPAQIRKNCRAGSLHNHTSTEWR